MSTSAPPSTSDRLDPDSVIINCGEQRGDKFLSTGYFAVHAPGIRARVDEAFRRGGPAAVAELFKPQAPAPAAPAQMGSREVLGGNHRPHWVDSSADAKDGSYIFEDTNYRPGSLRPRFKVGDRGYYTKDDAISLRDGVAL